MLPMTFDDQALGDMPLPGPQEQQRLAELLSAILARRILPYFRRRSAVDPTRLARLAGELKLVRHEDSQRHCSAISIVIAGRDGWTLYLHERVFDYLAFVLPSDPDTRLVDAAPEQRRALAVCELLLRHETEHVLYPGRDEHEVVLGDLEFAADRREADPTYYRTLREALAERAAGLDGGDYHHLLEQAERDLPPGDLVAAIVERHAERVAAAPRELLALAFPTMGRQFKSRLLDACYRASRSSARPLLERTRWLTKLTRLFVVQADADATEAEILFHAFRQRWGTEVLLHELDLAGKDVDQVPMEQLFLRVRDRMAELSTLSDEPPGETPAVSRQRRPVREPEQEPARLSLKERIEAARSDPLVPRSVLAAIDKNKNNLHGVSGAKYTELLETVLAVPWGHIEPIRVAAEDFARGLDLSHYGLSRPKDVLADFFTNLIWRYRRLTDETLPDWRHNGAAFLLVGPPGVGKTSLAISAARNLGIPFHKLSLGGMRDEADLRGHGFTYEGSKPGGIVQGLIKMNAMNGMFILDEADKTEKFAIATLLEILDPEQNHMFHDKYVDTTVDIDLSNCIFVLTANTLETVPPPVVDRCEVVLLDRYAVEEKVTIAREHLIPRVRERYDITHATIVFDPDEQDELVRHLVTTYTREAGVRQLERVLRTLFLRAHRTLVPQAEQLPVQVTHESIKHFLEEPLRARLANPDDRVGEMLALGVDAERGIGSVIPIQATALLASEPGAQQAGSLSMVHATGNLERVMDESRKVAMTGILHCAEQLGIKRNALERPIHLHFMGASTRKDGPSAGGAIALALTSLLSGRPIRRDVAMTGEIDTHGRITGVGGLDVKLETADEAGCRTVIIPRENLDGPHGIERFPEALRRELQVLTFEQWSAEHEPFDFGRHTLQVVAVDDILQAAAIAIVDEEELVALEEEFATHALSVAPLFQGGLSTRPSTQLVYVKQARELADDVRRAATCSDCEGCGLLVLPEALEEVAADLPEGPGMPPAAFDAAYQDIVQAVQEAREGILAGGGSGELTVVAPFYVLTKGGAVNWFTQPWLRLFANNFTAQGLKVKRCKSLLNRLACYLGRLEETELESCPFVTRHEGVWMADLGVIPEKYRLDAGRAEDLLHRCVTRWLSEVDRNLEHAPAAVR